MTHAIATRNSRAKVSRPSAERMARLIELMSRYWVDADLAGEDVEDRRLAISKAYLVNHLGLVMYIEERVKEGLRLVQIHHLPRQDHRTIANAISLLTPHEVSSGISAVLSALVNQHPFTGGTIPIKPGWTRVEAKALCIKRESSAGDGRSLKDAALELISDHWVSVREWDKLMKTTRLPAVIVDLESDGYDICVEMRSDETGSKSQIAVYHYFEDPGERDAWNLEQAQKQFMRKQAEAEAAARDAAAEQDKRNQKVLAGAARRAGKSLARTPHSGGSQYGGWVKSQLTPAGHGIPNQKGSRQMFQASTPASAPTRPSAVTMARISSMQGKGPPKVEVNSASDVPAAELNCAYPSAGSKQEVQFGGDMYVRRFRPRKNGDTITAWEVFWERTPSRTA